jgi:hypothetical protein
MLKSVLKQGSLQLGFQQLLLKRVIAFTMIFKQVFKQIHARTWG